MSMASPSGKGSQEVDLNLAPIIDCLTVLVTFLLASASFLSVGVLDAGVGAPAEKSATETPPSLILQAEIDDHHEVTLKLSGKSTQTLKVPAKGNQLDYLNLKSELSNLKQKWPELQSLILSAAEEVPYQDLIQTMDEVRGIIPSVLLGGF